jgi:predicted transcriptional regulator
MKPSLKALPPSEWRVMYLLWRHGPLTVAEVHRLSPEHNLTTVATFLKRLVAKGYLTTTIERSPAVPGRPPERYFPRVDYQTGLEVVVQELLADYLFQDPAGLSYLATTAQQRLDHALESLPAAKAGDGLQLVKPS